MRTLLPLSLHTLEKPVEHDHLGRVINQMLISRVRWSGFGTLEKIGVVTTLS